jgi:hypothetical protein
MAKSDQKVTSPQPIWLFLWIFALLVVCFLAAHHWHYKVKSKKLTAKYAPKTETFELSDVTKAKTEKQLRTLEGGQDLADMPRFAESSRL